MSIKDSSGLILFRETDRSALHCFLWHYDGDPSTTGMHLGQYDSISDSGFVPCFRVAESQLVY